MAWTRQPTQVRRGNVALARLFLFFYQNLYRGSIELSEQFSSVAVNVRKYGIAGLTFHLVGFVLAFISIGLVLGGVIDME
jgi:hypothetical protein